MSFIHQHYIHQFFHRLSEKDTLSLLVMNACCLSEKDTLSLSVMKACSFPVVVLCFSARC
jgi:hypothetical protein